MSKLLEFVDYLLSPERLFKLVEFFILLLLLALSVVAIYGKLCVHKYLHNIYNIIRMVD